jgi:hypothetical protein
MTNPKESPEAERSAIEKEVAEIHKILLEDEWRWRQEFQQKYGRPVSIEEGYKRCWDLLIESRLEVKRLKEESPRVDALAEISSLKSGEEKRLREALVFGRDWRINSHADFTDAPDEYVFQQFLASRDDQRPKWIEDQRPKETEDQRPWESM